MKTLFNLFIVLLMITVSARGQELKTPDAPLTSEDYLNKSKDQKLAGFVCLGASAVTLVVGSTGNLNLDALPIIGSAALAAAVGSITLFIAAGRNKRKAQMMMSSQKTAMGLPYRNIRAVTGITMAIPLGK